LSLPDGADGEWGFCLPSSIVGVACQFEILIASLLIFVLATYLRSWWWVAFMCAPFAALTLLFVSANDPEG